MNQIYILKNDTKFRGDTAHNYQKFGVPIGNARMNQKVRFYTEAPMIKYHQKIYNSCCLISLTSAFQCIGDNRAVTFLVNRIEESLTLQTEIFKSRIHFDNTIMKNRRKIKGEQNLQYNLTIWKKHNGFDILNDISEDVTVVQLMESLGNVNHAISVVGYWIFDSNYKKSLCLTQELSDIICSNIID